MIKPTIKVEGLQKLLNAYPTIVGEVMKAAKNTAKFIVQQQCNAILHSQTPTGQRQQEIAEITKIAKKKAKVHANIVEIPLYRTGLLANPRNWRVSKSKNGAIVRPPKERKDAVYILMRKGFRFIFNEEIPKVVVEYLEQQLNKIQSKL